MSTRAQSVHTVPAATQGRFLVSRPSMPPVGILVGFHGYGENAASHLAELERLDAAGAWLLVAVQGLHRFYSRHGQVIASWMTSEDREAAIADNIRYVADVVRSVRREAIASARLVYAGFSQGAAMACRAAAFAGLPCDGLIMLGGDIPPEIHADDAVTLPPVVLGRGRRDDWYSQAKQDADQAFLDRRGIDVEVVIFDGGHEWSDVFRTAAGRMLGRLS